MGVMTMKKAIKLLIILLIILLLITITVISCVKSGSNIKKVAQEFCENLYTVDREKVTEYNRFLKEIKNTKEPDKLIGLLQERLKSIDKGIEPLMTKKGYENTVMNRMNTLALDICIEGDYTLQVTDFILGENQYDDGEDKAGYYYEVKLNFISEDGKTEQTDTAKGYIGLIKENGQWKVFAHKPQKLPQMYK